MPTVLISGPLSVFYFELPIDDFPVVFWSEYYMVFAISFCMGQTTHVIRHSNALLLILASMQLQTASLL